MECEEKPQGAAGATADMEEQAQSLMQITGVPLERARVMIEAFQDLNAAVDYFYESEAAPAEGAAPAGAAEKKEPTKEEVKESAERWRHGRQRQPRGGRKTGRTETNTAVSPPPLPAPDDTVQLPTNVNLFPSGDVPSHLGISSRIVGEGVTVVATLAWKPPFALQTVEVVLCPMDTVGKLKQCIYSMTGVPVVTQRLVMKARNISDNLRTLSAYGFASRNELAVLFPRRDVDGPVVFIREGRQCFQLKQGEWCPSTSITETRKLVAGAMGAPPTSVLLIYNGLRLRDCTSFAQCGLHSGSKVHVLRTEDACFQEYGMQATSTGDTEETDM